MANIKRAKVPFVMIAVVLLWIGVALVGFKTLNDYGLTPGKPATIPSQWPADSSLKPQHDRATLVMFVHPQCPCSRASIGELASLMAHTRSKLDAYVLFMAPKGFSDHWVKSDLWQSAAAIPGVKNIADPDGLEAKRFHVTTSGNIALYNPAGKLLFQGGITASRGHFGDSIGRDSALAALAGNPPKSCSSAVFGCPLFNETSGIKNQ